jgi:poly(3-hydroxybutyrate) depolymerase
LRTPAQWGDLVRAASDHKAPWPKISIWHGGLDAVVNINNAQASVAQWADLHGVSLLDAKQDMVEGAIRLHWGDRLEVYTLPALGHGTPIDSRDLGQPGPFILEAGISSTRRIAEFWGLSAAAARPAEPQILLEIEATLLHRPASLETAQKESLVMRALKAVGLVRR